LAPPPGFVPPDLPRPRLVELFDRAEVLRLRVLAPGFAAVLAAVPDLVERLAPEAEDLARVDEAFLAPLLRAPVDDLAPLLRDVVPLRDDEELLEPSSAPHLPDITRCAASATASAMSEPSLVALAIMLLAVSAASRPASRIARRAFGLALIAAAAAARPAASISLLIAALAIRSTVSLREEFLSEELLSGDFAIGFTPSV
jgi:hypothetical protein